MRCLLYAVALSFLTCHAASAFDACAADAAAHYAPVENYYSRGLLFKIEKCGIPESYLFGTLHSDDAKYNALLNRLAPALMRTNRSYFEIVADAANESAAAAYMQLPQDGRASLRSLVGEPLFSAAAKEMSKKNFPPEVTDRLTPWAVAVLLQLPPSMADGKVIDDKLQRYFLAQKKPVSGLETLEDHFRVFTGMAQEKQVILLKEAVQDVAQSDASNRELDQAYSAQDLNAIDRLGDQAFAEVGDGELRGYLENKLLLERNMAMAETLEPLLPQGSLFIAVGAMHLPDEKGLIKLIEDQGYFITPVSLQ